MIRNTVIALSLVTAVATPLAAQQARPAMAAQQAAPKPDPVFDAKLKEALERNPQFIIDAVGKMQQRQRDEQAAQQNAAVGTSRTVLLARQAFGPVIGNEAATTTVAEFLDYRCGYCKRAATIVDKIADEDKNVRFVVVMRPILGPDSETLARFALAAARQGKFRVTHDAIYALPGGSVTDDVLKGVADKVGVDFAKAKIDMTGDAVTAELKKHQAMSEKLGVNGTPYFVTPKSVIPGAPQSEEQLKAAITG